MQFQEIIGQEALKNKLINLVQNSRVPHALMLSGDTGYGILPLALGLAQYIMCQNPGTQDSCGECSQCVKMKDLQHPDLLLSFPVVSQKGPATSLEFYSEFIDFAKNEPYGDINDWLKKIESEKKLPNIIALEARRIIDRLALKNIENPKKVMIMWLPEYLGKEGNILLKQIEEPTPNTIMIFASAHPKNLLGTIRSRVQDIKVGPIGREDIATALQEKFDLEAHKAEVTALLSEGNWTEAQKISSSEEDPFIDLFKAWLNVVFTHRIDLQIQWVETLKSIPKNQVILFLSFLNKLLREFLVYLYNPDGNQNSAYSDLFPKLAEKINDLSMIEKLQENIEDVSYAIRRNAQLDLALHNLCINAQYLSKNYEYIKP